MVVRKLAGTLTDEEMWMLLRSHRWQSKEYRTCLWRLGTWINNHDLGWRTKDGHQVKVRSVTNQHLINAANRMVRKNPHEQNIHYPLFRAICVELYWRNLDVADYAKETVNSTVEEVFKWIELRAKSLKV